MKSKIGKLNKDWLQIQPEHRDLYRKVDEIIDYLNSQDQKEENNFVHTVGTPMLESTTTCSQDTPEEDKELHHHFNKELKCIRCGILPDDVTSAFCKDTPEEWEKNISILIKEGLFEEVTDDKGERVFGYIGCSDKVLKEIKQLLDDREREVVERIVKETRNMERLSIKQGIEGDKAMKRLRNLIESLYKYKLLNNKKK